MFKNIKKLTNHKTADLKLEIKKKLNNWVLLMPFEFHLFTASSETTIAIEQNNNRVSAKSKH